MPKRLIDRSRAHEFFGLGSSYWYRLPHLKFMYFIRFVPISGAGSSSMKDITISVKNIDRPKMSFETQKLNQYNKKRIVQTHSDVGEIRVTFYDIVDHRVEAMFMEYFRYYYAQASYNNTSSWRNDVVSPNMVSPWGYQPTASAGQISYFEKIEIYEIHGKKFNKWILMNPRIKDFAPDGNDACDTSGLNEISFTIESEGLIIEPYNSTMGGEQFDYGSLTPAPYDSSEVFSSSSASNIVMGSLSSFGSSVMGGMGIGGNGFDTSSLMNAGLGMLSGALGSIPDNFFASLLSEEKLKNSVPHVDNNGNRIKNSAVRNNVEAMRLNGYSKQENTKTNPKVKSVESYKPLSKTSVRVLSNEHEVRQSMGVTSKNNKLTQQRQYQLSSTVDPSTASYFSPSTSDGARTESRVYNDPFIGSDDRLMIGPTTYGTMPNIDSVPKTVNPGVYDQYVGNFVTPAPVVKGMAYEMAKYQNVLTGETIMNTSNGMKLSNEAMAIVNTSRSSGAPIGTLVKAKTDIPRPISSSINNIGFSEKPPGVLDWDNL